MSSDGLAVSHSGPTSQRKGALVEPAVRAARRCYAEWAIEGGGLDSECNIMVGVTALAAVPPAGQYMCGHPSSRMFCCWDSNVYPGGRSWGPTGRLSQGDRVGLMVEGRSVSVYINGALLGPGPMATDLPPQVPAVPCLCAASDCPFPCTSSKGSAFLPSAWPGATFP